MINVEIMSNSDIINTKHTSTYKYQFKISKNFEQDYMKKMKWIASITKSMRVNGLTEGKDYDVFNVYDGIILMSEEETVITVARLLV